MAKDIRVTLELDNNKFNTQLNRSEQNVKGFERTTTGSFAKSAAAAAAFATALAGVKSGLNIAATFQDLRSSLSTVFGGLNEGADAFDRVTDIASKTQFQVEDITKAFIQLKGAGVEPTKDIIMTFANAAAITTDQLGAFQAAISLISRTTAGGLGLEELERLGDRGIPVYDILNKKLGLTRLEISKAGQTAKGAAEIIQALGEGINERFGSALENRLSNTNQRISNFNDALSLLADNLLSDANVGFGKLLENLTATVQSLNDNIETVTKFIKVLGTLGGVLIVGRLLKGVTSAISAIKPAGDLATKSIFGFAGASTKARTPIGDIRAGLRALGRNLGIIPIQGKPVLDVMGRFRLSFGLLASGLLRFLGPLGLVITGFQLLDLAMTRFRSPATIVKNNIGPLQDKLQDLTEDLKEANAELERQQEIGDRGKLGGGTGYIEQAEKRVERIKKAILETQAALDKGLAAIPQPGDAAFVGPVIPKAGSDGTGDVVKQISVIDRLDEAIKGVNENFRSVEQFKVYIGLLEKIKSEVSSNEEWQAYEQAIKDVEAAFGMTVKDVFEPALTRIQELNEEIGKVENFDDFNAVLDAINQSFRDGDINIDQYNKALQDLKGSLTEAEMDMAIFQNAIKDIDSAIANDLTNALFEGENAIDALKSTFKEAVKQMIADTIRLMVVQTALQAIFGFFGYSATFAPSGGISNITKKQFGGPVMKNKPYIVGEAGPELFVPGNGGSIIPNGQYSMGGVQNVTYNIQATDAQSFQALVARDPSFIHAVASKGASQLPSGRRF